MFLPPANEVRGKVIFLHMCVILSTGGACMVVGGGVCGCRGACVVAGGHACWGVHGCWGACVVAGGCMIAGGHAWLRGGVRAYGGVCMVARGCAWLQGGMCGCWGGMRGWGAVHGCWGEGA